MLVEAAAAAAEDHCARGHSISHCGRLFSSHAPIRPELQMSKSLID
jgi:hypothetical protein